MISYQNANQYSQGRIQGRETLSKTGGEAEETSLS